MKFLIKPLTAVFLLTIYSCNITIDKPEPLYYKRIQTTKLLLEWYKVSLITSVPPDYIILSLGNFKDTICQSDNIIDVNVFKKDSIVLKFCGKPKIHSKLIALRETVLGLKISYDITDDCNIISSFRETFKIDKK